MWIIHSLPNVWNLLFSSLLHQTASWTHQETAVNFLSKSESFLSQRSKQLLSIGAFHPITPQHCLHGNQCPQTYMKSTYIRGTVRELSVSVYFVSDVYVRDRGMKLEEKQNTICISFSCFAKYNFYSSEMTLCLNRMCFFFFFSFLTWPIFFTVSDFPRG